MAKVNLKVFKKGKPVYWIIGGVVLFVVFYLLFSGGNKAQSGTTQYIETGPSEALQIAGMQSNAQLQAAQLSASIENMRIQSDLALGQRSAEIALFQLESGAAIALADLANRTRESELNAEYNRQINLDNISYGVETARLAYETQIELKTADNALLARQMDTQALMFAEQSRNLTMQSLIGATGTLKKKDRDTYLGAVLATSQGRSFSGGKGDDYFRIGASQNTIIQPNQNASIMLGFR